MIKYFSFLLLFVLPGCTPVKFKQAQPAGAQNIYSFPEDFRGKYLDENGDSLIIGETHYLYASRESKMEGNYSQTLSDSTFLRKIANYYVLNSLKADSLWNVMLVSKTGDSTLNSWFINGDDPQSMKTISGITRVDSVLDEKGKAKRYILDPSPKELEKIIDEGGFTRLLIHNRIR